MLVEDGGDRLEFFGYLCFSESLGAYIGLDVALVIFLEARPVRSEKRRCARYDAVRIAALGEVDEYVRRPRPDDGIDPETLFFLEALDQSEFLRRESRRHKRLLRALRVLKWVIRSDGSGSRRCRCRF